MHACIYYQGMYVCMYVLCMYMYSPTHYFSSDRALATVTLSMYVGCMGCTLVVHCIQTCIATGNSCGSGLRVMSKALLKACLPSGGFSSVMCS